MAEVFGAVASGIGIAGVAAQAIDGIRKLQAFCNDIRDAPEEVKYLTTELGILLGTIASIEAQIQKNSNLCGSMNPTPALRFVDQSVRSFNTVIERLNSEISQRRTMGSIKMAWKKKALESHLLKIERSKTSLGLAVSAYSTELYLQAAMRTETRIDQLSMNVTTQIASYQAQLTASFGPHHSDSQRIRRNDQFVVDKGDDKDWAGIREKHKPPKWISVISFTLSVPLWLSQRSLQIDVRRTAQNWTLSLRPYRTIPYDAETWDAVRFGNFDRMRSLIESGQATVFDRRGDGTTLLHRVCTWGPPLAPEVFSRMARYLVDRGADVNEPTRDG
ncbi:hypothetical protein KCU81_g3944, partial [Aureobasidium melanogenum]|uniref:Uncharacterized protein n=1 Tax=Aureobasidium melanogenum (strain CBS 110374) TaxID=1043003 RepID=A0A074VP62_AURM1